MSDRADLIDSFLRQAGLAGAARRAIPGDASARRYERLTDRGKTLILMDVPDHATEDAGLFLDLTRWLSRVGLKVADIIAEDPENGLVILEDLGEDLFARVCERTPCKEPTLYDAAVDVLVALHDADLASCPDLPEYDIGFARSEARLALEWYLSAISDDWQHLVEPLDDVLGAMMGEVAKPVVVLRDFHAENLFWLPERRALNRVGLIDFQGALLGSPAYDLASLITDARRDVSAEVAEGALRRFCTAQQLDPTGFAAQVSAWGVQRNLKILGIFARLSRRDGKAGYLEYLPRVWAYLQRDLAHPALGDMAKFVKENIPPPTDDLIRDLQKAQHA